MGKHITDQHQTASFFQKAAYIITLCYSILLFCIFPLYSQNGYINILEAKTSFYIIFSSGYAVLCGLLLVLFFFQNKKNGFMKKGAWGIFSPEFFLYASALLFFLVLLCSTFLSENPVFTLNGTDGKLFGSGILFLCILTFFGFSCYFHMHSILLWGCLLSNSILFLLIILNRFRIDPLHMYDNILSDAIPDYLGTIGQINVVSGYVCIFLPFIMGLFLYSKTLLSKILYGICVFLGICAGICSNSDSFFLGLAGCLLFYFWFAFSSGNTLLSFACIPVIGTASALCLRLWTNAAHKEAIWRTAQLTYLEKIPWMPVFLAFLFAAFFLYKKLPSEQELSSALWKRIHHFLFACAGTALVLLIVFAFMKNSTGTETSSNSFLFSDSWGTNRGYVWKRTIPLWRELSFREKLFGVGPGGFQQFFSVYYMDSIERFGYYFIDAHNEFLQFLVTTGILGVIGYFGMFLSCIWHCRKHQSEYATVIACVLLTYLLQGMVNNPLVFTTPYAFLFMGMEIALSRKEQ